MADAFMPGATAAGDASAGGALAGGDGRWLTITTTEQNPYKVTAADSAKGVADTAHLVLNPISGDIVQTVGFDKAATEHTEGSLNVVCAVVAYAAEPFTNYWSPAGREAWQEIVAYLGQFEVPVVFPCAPFTPFDGEADENKTDDGNGIIGESDWGTGIARPGAIEPAALVQTLGVPYVSPVVAVKMLQEILGIDTSGTWDEETDTAAQAFAEKVLDQADQQATVTPVQRWLGVPDDGVWGPVTNAAYHAARSHYWNGSTSNGPLPVPFPLAAGTWYGKPGDGVDGSVPKDRAAIKKIQAFVAASTTGLFDAETLDMVQKRQRWDGLDPDGEVGKITWSRWFGGE